MSLLARIQENNNQTSGMPPKNYSSLESSAYTTILDLGTTFREQRPKNKKKDRVNEHKKDKNQELKNGLHKKIPHNLKEDESNEIIPILDDTAKEITNGKEEIRGPIDQKKVVQKRVNDLTDFGLLNPLLLDKDVSEVMVNGPDQVYYERKGKIELSPIRFRDNDQLMRFIRKIVSQLGYSRDESSPMIDARLPDGSRINAILPPLALNGPTITIRKFSKNTFQIKDLINLGTLTEEMANFLAACVKARLNIFVSGGPRSGKTTTLNVLSKFIPDNERIVTVEDAAEIQLDQEHVSSLESPSSNIEGEVGMSIRDLVRNSKRMRPDRIILGEVRGEEALDMLQAMNTGHDGSLVTVHSTSPKDMISRLETMLLLADVDLPVKPIRAQIAGAIDVIIQQSRLKDGSRKIVSITEVQGMEGEIVVQDIFKFKQEGLNTDGKIIGGLVPTGVMPKFFDRLDSSGIHVPASVFIDNE